MFVESSVLDIFLKGTVLSMFAVLLIILNVRVVGLRSFSKMTNFDFVITIAIGSLLSGACTTTKWSDFSQSCLAILALFILQYAFAKIRKEFKPFKEFIENKPAVLMRNGKFIESELKSTRVTKDDVVAKLREANVLELSKVQAVILETTGDISVLHGNQDCSEKILDGTIQ